MDPAEKERRMRAARKHFRFCNKIYQHQVKEGRYFLHEHPYGAKSWQEPEIVAMLKKETNILAKLDHCQYGLWIKKKDGFWQGSPRSS